jgi:hypothetical protein
MTPNRLKFEMIEPTPKEPSMALTELTKRTPQNPDLVHELADGLDFLIQQLAAAEGDRDAARTQSRSLDRTIAEQQKALIQSMQTMRRLEIEVEALRNRMEGISPAAAPAPAPPPPIVDRADPEPAPELEANPAVVVLEQKVALLETQLAAKDAELETLRKSSAASPEAAMRILEDQRDQARNEAAVARADLSLQAAELETKETLIQTLEQALEQQHTSLRGLEEKFALYAAKLEELRLDRLQALHPKKAEEASERALDSRDSAGSSSALKRLFSRPKREVATSNQEDSQA